MAFVLALITILTLLPDSTVPLTGYHDWNSVFYGNIARNHLRLGLATTKLGLVTSSGYFPHAQLAYYNHHPILLPIVMAFSFFLFGITAFGARILPIMSIGMTVYFLSKLVSHLFRPQVAVIASIIIMVIPLVRYYGLIPVNETIVLGFIALTVWKYYHWLQTHQNASYLWSLAGLFLAQLTGWGGYYLSLYLPLHAFIFARKHFHAYKLQVLGYLGVAVSSITFFIVHNLWLSGWQAFTSLQQIFLFRAKLPVNYLKYFIHQANWITAYFSRFVILLSFVYVGLFVFRRLKKFPISIADSFMFLWLAFGLTQVVFLPNHAFIHEYDLIYLLPFVAVTTAVILTYIVGHRLLLAGLMLVIIAVERQPFLAALQKTRLYNPGYIIGNYLNRNTKTDAKILILNTELIRFYDVYLNFYSDRLITSKDNLTYEDLIYYDYIVIPKTHDYVKPQDKLLLYTSFPHLDTPYAIIFTNKSHE